MRRLWYWARELDLFAVFAAFFVVLAIVAAVLTVLGPLTFFAGLLLVIALGFSAVTSGLLSLR